MWLLAAIMDGQIYSVIILLSTYTILLVAQMVKNLPAIQETWVQSLIWEDPPEKRMSTHSSILAWRIPWTEEPGRLRKWDQRELDMTEQLSLSLFTSFRSACD